MDLSRVTLKAWLCGALLLQGIYGCVFEGLLSSCHMTVGGIAIQASARINHCHSPIDITFLLQSSTKPKSLGGTPANATISWKYTYVTSNQPESLEIPGSDRRIMLHICAQTERKPGANVVVPVKAHFLLDGQSTEDMTFLDDTVRIAHFEDCAFAAEQRTVGKVAMGGVLSVTFLCLLGVFLLLGHHHRRRGRPDDEVNLVSHMADSQLTPRRSDEVFYVVPPRDGQQEDSYELQVYVSTSNGLKPVKEDVVNKNSSRLEAAPEPISPPARVSPPPGSPSSTTSATETPNDSPSSSIKSSCTSGPRSLGAIPKRKQGDNSSASSSSSSSVISR